MGWRFRQSFSPIPGVRLTLSPSGFTTSVGAGPVRLSMGPRGAAVTATIPGTGLSYRQPLTTRSPRQAPGTSNLGHLTSPPAPPLLPQQPRSLPPPLSSPSAPPGLQPIQSSGTSVLTSDGLAGFKEALGLAQRQYSEVERDRNGAAAQETTAVEAYRKWHDGWLFKRIMKTRFAELAATAEEAAALRKELDDQLELSKLRTHFEMPEGVAHTFSRLVDDFVALSRSQRIWDNTAHRATNKVVERTAASRVIDLKPVSFSLGRCGVIVTDAPVPKMQNANGGDIFLYPGFIVYMVSEVTYALIEYGELNMLMSRTRFHEEAAVPSDAEQIGITWAKCNKDGTPDRRFKDNYQIPVMQYALFVLQTSRGLNEEYLVSNVAASEAFVRSWNSHVLAIRERR